MKIKATQVAVFSVIITVMTTQYAFALNCWEACNEIVSACDKNMKNANNTFLSGCNQLISNCEIQAEDSPTLGCDGIKVQCANLLDVMPGVCDTFNKNCQDACNADQKRR